MDDNHLHHPPPSLCEVPETVAIDLAAARRAAREILAAMVNIETEIGQVAPWLARNAHLRNLFASNQHSLKLLCDLHDSVYHEYSRNRSVKP